RNTRSKRDWSSDVCSSDLKEWSSSTEWAFPIAVAASFSSSTFGSCFGTLGVESLAASSVRRYPCFTAQVEKAFAAAVRRASVERALPAATAEASQLRRCARLKEAKSSVVCAKSSRSEV